MAGLALKELASQEEEDSGIKAPLLLGAVVPVAPTAEKTPVAAEAEVPSDEPLLAADGTPRRPGVKYDYWGRPMA